MKIFTNTVAAILIAGAYAAPAPAQEAAKRTEGYNKIVEQKLGEVQSAASQ